MRRRNGRRAVDALLYATYVFPIIVTVPLLVECQQDSSVCTISILRFTGEDMAVTGL